jgi:hypothetical protein
MKRALMVEFASSGALASAARLVRERGHTELDAYGPYSTEEVREALGMGRSRLPVAVLCAALLGAGTAYFIQWGTTAYLYPLNVGGRPPHMPLGYVPITFEMGVLAAAATAFFGVLVLGKLIKLWDPVFEVPGFEGASVDRFWLRVDEGRGPFDPEALWAALEPLEPLQRFVLEAS